MYFKLKNTGQVLGAESILFYKSDWKCTLKDILKRHDTHYLKKLKHLCEQIKNKS